ncbi:type II toxin-antitoxin system RelE/ParE family toxin [Collinsella sp. An7]|nr:type II toxin-antitoxin system RelE/ParE family toxin [Collinsella sp. An7]
MVTNGFVKKTQRTPRREIEKAKRYRDDWRMRYGQRKRTPRSLS